jgi:hypothetical protein
LIWTANSSRWGALHSCQQTAREIVLDAGADYSLTIKDNCPATTGPPSPWSPAKTRAFQSQIQPESLVHRRWPTLPFQDSSLPDWRVVLFLRP